MTPRSKLTKLEKQLGAARPDGPRTIVLPDDMRVIEPGDPVPGGATPYPLPAEPVKLVCGIDPLEPV